MFKATGPMLPRNVDRGGVGPNLADASQPIPLRKFCRNFRLCLAASMRSQPPLMEFGRKLREFVESN
jgi:hypothetical protein